MSAVSTAEQRAAKSVESLAELTVACLVAHWAAQKGGLKAAPRVVSKAVNLVE